MECSCSGLNLRWKDLDPELVIDCVKVALYSSDCNTINVYLIIYLLMVTAELNTPRLLI